MMMLSIRKIPIHVFLFIVLVQLTESVMIPPKITQQSPEDIFYKRGETVKMVCVASGSPQPNYSWKRAELDFSPEANDDRIVKQKNSGTLIINSPEDKDQGIYQCFATNSQGKAATIKYNLKMAKLDDFSTYAPITKPVDLGAPLTLNCQSPESVPDAQIFWIMNDDGNTKPVDWNSRVTMDYEDRLYFTYVTKDDEKGNPYQCVVSNKIMRKSSVGPPQIIQTRGTDSLLSPMKKLWPTSRFDEQGLVGTNHSMKCIFSGNPAPTVLWKRKDNIPFSNRVLQGLSGGQEIVIQNLQFEDAGTYLCDSNKIQDSTILEMSFNLNINSRPTWTSKPKDITISENGTAQFECLAVGVPKPQIFWFVNGEPLETALKNDKRLDSRFQHLREEIVVLQKVTKQDTMVFQCNVTNLHGYIWGEAYLNVLSEAPSILTTPSNTIVSESQPFEMVCEITGKPDSVLTWYKDGHQITGGRYVVNETGSLHVQTAVLSDAGSYRCEAYNRFGSVDAEASLVVRRKTVIEWAPMDLEVQRGVNAKFTCSGTTDPEEVSKLITTWYKDGDRVDLGNRMFLNLQDHSLTISGSEQRDTGSYTCVVSNGLDSDTASARLVVTDIPDIPTEVKINNSRCVTSDPAEITWIAGSFNNAPIEYFVIEYMTKADPNRWVFAYQADYRKDTAPVNLAAGMDYSFRVTSYNKIGASIPSAPTNTSCVTKSSLPSQNPRNVRTIGDKRGWLHIVWTPVPPEYQGSSNFFYLITIYKVGDAENNFFTKKIPDWRVYEFFYDTGGLDYRLYTITVRSSNSEGFSGDEIRPFNGTSSEGAPTISPSNLIVSNIQSDNAVFSWQFDHTEIVKNDSRIRGEFRGFKVQFWEQGNQAATMRDFDVLPTMYLPNSTSLDTFSARVPYLIPNSRLQARVAVLNNFFVSAPSEVINFVTPPGLPGPVELLRDINIGDNHVNLQWKPPLDSKGDVIGYDIGYQKVHGLHIDAMQERMPQIDDQFATTAMLSGLMPNTTYRIHIWARTLAGRGDAFFIERRTVLPGVPMIPRFTISSIGTDYINITWFRDAYQKSGSVIFVEYKKEDGAEWFSTIPDVSKDWVKLAYLQPGLRYNIRIGVTNGETTRLSQIEDVTTDGTALAYDVVANLGWFLGVIFTLLLEIVLVTVFVICYRRGFRFKTSSNEIRTYTDGSETYTGTHYNRDEIKKSSMDYTDEPGGYSNHNYKNGYNDDEFDEEEDEFDEYDSRYNWGRDERRQDRKGDSSFSQNSSHDYEDYVVDEHRVTRDQVEHADTGRYTTDPDDVDGQGEWDRYHDDQNMADQRKTRLYRDYDDDQYSDNVKKEVDRRAQNESHPVAPERRKDRKQSVRTRESPHSSDTDRLEDYNSRQRSRYHQDSRNNSDNEHQGDDNRDYSSRSRQDSRQNSDSARLEVYNSRQRSQYYQNSRNNSDNERQSDDRGDYRSRYGQNFRRSTENKRHGNNSREARAGRLRQDSSYDDDDDDKREHHSQHHDHRRSNDNTEDHSDDHHPHAHSDFHRDHAKCDEVVEEFRRSSTGPVQDEASDNSHEYSTYI